jgi:hypothetical protein
MSNNNPANKIEGLPKGFRPMNSAVLKLEVPQRDGYHRHWFRGTPERISRARQAGYRFVEAEDLGDDAVNSFDLAGDSDSAGSTDMGSRVSVISGDDIAGNGQPSRLYLMECPLEYYEAGQKVLADRNEGVASALRGGKIGAGHDGETVYDQNNRYLKGTAPDLFTPNKRRR